MKNGQKLKLGDVPWTPQEISKKYKRQSLGMPEAPPLHQQKAPGHFSMRYIFIASCNMCYSWSVFIFVVCFIFNKVGPHHLLLWSETRSAALHIYFGVRHAPLFLHFVLERDTLHLNSSLIFLVYYLWEWFQISWLVLEVEKKFRVFSDANGSLFRPWHRLWHVMLDVILWTYQLCLYHDLSQIAESVHCAIGSFMHCF